MLRLTELKLPLNHLDDALRVEILKRLQISAQELQNFSVFRRGYDARKKSAINLIYTVDVEVKNETALLKKFKNTPHIGPTPDTRYHFVAHATDNVTERPVIIGMGPCGLFAGLLLAQMGFRPIILERGKAVRERTKDTWGL